MTEENIVKGVLVIGGYLKEGTMKLASEIKNIIIKNYVRKNNFEAEIEAVSKVLAERIEINIIKAKKVMNDKCLLSCGKNKETEYCVLTCSILANELAKYSADIIILKAE